MIALDLGSNTLRVLAVNCQDATVLYDYSKVVKTADGLAKSGKIDSQAIARVIAALSYAQASFDFEKHTIKAVTTEAIRCASNASIVLEEIAKQTGVFFEIISGEEEARLTLLAVEHRLQMLKSLAKSFVTVDIGGGSTEITFKYPRYVISRSFPVGIVTIVQSYQGLENIKEALPKVMQEMQSFCSETYKAHGRVDTFVATAGTPTTVAAMKLGQNALTYDANKINGTLLEIEELNFYLEKLLVLSFEQRELAVGTGRSDLIAAGILIYKQLYTILDFSTGMVIDDGLREGVVLDSCRRQ